MKPKIPSRSRVEIARDLAHRYVDLMPADALLAWIQHPGLASLTLQLTLGDSTLQLLVSRQSVRDPATRLRPVKPA